MQVDTPSALHALNFDNRFVRELPADPEGGNHRRQVTEACFSRVHPIQVPDPRLVSCAREMTAELDLPEHICETDDFVQVFSGNRILEGMDPFAMCYGGHQFGNWAGQLGDGRAINLGEVVNREGRRWMLQLKGAGPTPYSRTADGLAVLRSSVREFLCSEAMFHLGVPTTRALSLVLTGDQVVRDMFYDGHPQHEPGAIVCRVSPSFTRFGNFQIFGSRGEIDVLRQLVDYTIRVDFPHLGEPSPDSIVAMYDEVCRRTADMIVHWMRVGFVHGVMNTDNMSILGLTIDYGPYGWLENYDPDWTPNTTDAGGRRYRYGHQPQIAQWNLMMLGNALAPLLEDVSPLQSVLDGFTKHCESAWNDTLAQKLGLETFRRATDEELTADLLAFLSKLDIDMTLFFRGLAEVKTGTEDLTDADLLASIVDAYYPADAPTEQYRARFGQWIRRYITRLEQDETPDETRRERMNAVNPKYVLRNYLAQLAIDKATEGDVSMVNDLLEVLRHPYDEQPGREEFAEKRPEWARHRAGCSMLSCSS
jgi:uncharacterized protein YdiU (UPF0061 family)